jgi:hypothetical protein
MRTPVVWRLSWLVAAVCLVGGLAAMSATAASADSVGVDPSRSYSPGEMVTVSGTGCHRDDVPTTATFYFQARTPGTAPDLHEHLQITGQGKVEADGSWSGFLVVPLRPDGEYYVIVLCEPRGQRSPDSWLAVDPVPVVRIHTPVTTTTVPASSTTSTSPTSPTSPTSSTSSTSSTVIVVTTSVPGTPTPTSPEAPAPEPVKAAPLYTG